MSVTVHIDHRPMLGPVRDQGPRPTCLSHASTTAHEHARGSPVALSPEYLHYFASNNESANEGVEFTDVSRALFIPGQPTEIACPYHENEPSPAWTPPAVVTLYRRHSITADHSPYELETLLQAGHLPVLGISTTEDFYTPTSPWIISPTGPIRGLHAVVAVGIGTMCTERRFLIRNSWGTAWGDIGHAWIDDNFIVQHLREVLVLTEEAT